MALALEVDRLLLAQPRAEVRQRAVGDRERVGYRFSGRNPDGRFVVEQQAYLSERDGRIGWMRALCSGFRRAG